MHLLIFGFGYTAKFVAQKLQGSGIKVTATTRDIASVACYPECNVIHFSAASIEQALKTTTHILISTPPLPILGDPVLAAFGNLLQKYTHTLQWIGYLSSTGVYGNYNGDWVDEDSLPINPGVQGKLRLDVELSWKIFSHLPLAIFRLAGIYGPGRNVLLRLLQGKTDTIVKERHFFSRIHVEDIAVAVIAAMRQTATGIYNVADDEPAPGYVVDEYASVLLNMPDLRRISYEDAVLSPMAQEFYAQNKRVSNRKLKRDLNLQLTYPSYREGLNLEKI